MTAGGTRGHRTTVRDTVDLLREACLSLVPVLAPVFHDDPADMINLGG